MLPLPPAPPAPTPDAGAAPSAHVRASDACAPGVGVAGPPVVCAGAPVADAAAAVAAAEAPVARSVTPPGATRLRASCATTVWSANDSAITTPTAAPSAASTLPVAVVASGARCVAIAEYAPVRTSGAPLPSRARVETLEIVTAMTPDTAVPPDAPPTAVVVTGATLDAASCALRAPPSDDPSPISARAPSFATVRATEAPIPVALAPPVPGRASVRVPCWEVASRVRSPPDRLTVAPGSIAARVRKPATVTASAPAAPTEAAPPAPEVDCAW